MALTRINNDQISDAINGNSFAGIDANTKLQNSSVTSSKLANSLAISGNLAVGSILTNNYYFANGTPFAGAQGTTGIQGATGAQGGTGAATNIIGLLALTTGNEEAELNAAFPGAVLGDGVIDSNTGDLWVTDGSDNWTDIGAIVGPQGTTGAQGVQGTQGIQGVQGIQGTQGVQGLQGIGSNYGNANVSAYLASGTNTANIITTGNITATAITTTGGDGNISGVDYFLGNAITVTGNVTGNYILGNGSQLVGMYGNADVATYLASGTDTANITTTGNISAANFTTTGATGNISGVNYFLGNAVTVTGNVTATNFIGNGSQLTDLPVQSGTYSNTNVQSYLNSFNGNIIPSANNVYTIGNLTNQWSSVYVSANTIYLNSVPLSANATTLFYDNLPLVSATSGGNIDTDGNISAGYFIGDGSALTNLPIQPGTYGNANVKLLLEGGISNNIVTTGNISAGYFIGDGSNLTGILPLTNGNSNINIATTNGYPTITANGVSTWTFGNTDVPNGLYWPDNSFQTTAFVGIATTAEALSNTGNATITTDPLGTNNVWNFDTTGNLILPDTAAILSAASIIIEANSTPNTSGVHLNGDADANVYAHADVVLTANTNGNSSTWTFGTGNVLTLPGSGSLIDSSDNNIELRGLNNFNVEAAQVVNLYTDDGTYQWQFGNDGNLTTPANTIIQSSSRNITIKGYGELGSNPAIAGSINLVAGNSGTGDGGNILIQSGRAPGAGGHAGNITISALNGTGGYNGVVTIQTDTGNNQWVFDATGNLTASGNITADYFLGDGSALTNLPVQPGTYGNANVEVLLESGTLSNNIITTGNVDANNVNLGSTVIYANGKVNSSSLSIDANVSARLSVIDPGTVYSTYFQAVESFANIYVADGGGDALWQFTANRSMTFPDSTVQNTAWTGSSNAISNGTSNVRIPTANSNVTINADTAGWTFSTDGNLNLPTNGSVNFNGGSITQVTNEDLYVRASDNEADGWSIFNVVDDGAGNTLTQTRLAYNDFTVRTNAQGASHTWAFRESGVLDLPGDINGDVGGNLTINIGDQVGSNTFIELRTTSYVGDALISNIRIANPNVTVSTSSGAYNWTFDSTGNLTLPGLANISGGNFNAGTANANVALNAFSSAGNIVSIQAQGNTSSAVISIFSNAGPVTSNWTFTTAPLDPSESFLYVPNGGAITTPDATGGEGGKNIFIQAGASDPVTWNSNPGGELFIKGGYGSFGDGGGGPGGDVYIEGGASSDSHAGNVNIASGLNTWVFDYTGTTTLPTVTNESAKFIGTRKVVGGLTAGAPYSVTLNAGGTPTVAYTSLTNTKSAKVTFAVQSNGAAFQWEQFDVIATPSEDSAGTVNFVVSNRVKGNSTVADTVVTATMSSGQIQISLNLDATQTSGGWASFDAVEFGYMVD